MLWMGNPSSDEARAAMSAGLIGHVATPAQGNAIPPGAPWCADNGCYSDNFDEAKWWAFLKRNAKDAATCLFAVAPDVVGDAEATLVRSAPWLPKIRELGYPAAFAAQDGLEHMTVPWDDIDVLFVGGTDAFKLGAFVRTLVAEAKARGKWVHMGRVNSQLRLTYASHIGCDSADGSILAKWPKNIDRVMAWARSTNQGDLFGVTA